MTDNDLPGVVNIFGTDDGVEIDGNDNIVRASGDITGVAGDGVDIFGDDNTVDAGGSIWGDPGVIIVGNDNNVSAGDEIIGFVGEGVIITGEDNTVENGSDAVFGFDNLGIFGGTDGVEVTVGGDDNTVDTAGGIFGATGDGVILDSNDNDVSTGMMTTANTPIGSTDLGIFGFQNGVDIGGAGAVNENTVTTDGFIYANSGIGVAINGDAKM